MKGHHQLHLSVNPGTTEEKRRQVLLNWYRDQLKARIPALLEHWQTVIGETVNGWGVKKMKTKWGSCNIARRWLWLNLELAKKPPECLEYVLVHEMVHLLERHHTERFRELLGHFLPQWPQARAILNRSPLAHENWGIR